jgi:predicted unusual protein kinase regulating ubiquinone biosynthesis (AarF/ABC1/UbiB family)
LEKQSRRATVFGVAGQVYVKYQLAKRKAKKLQTKLNIPEEVVDDHPEIRALWSVVHERNAVRLTNQIKSLRGFWVKVGQYLSSRADVMPVEYLRELASLTDSIFRVATAGSCFKALGWMFILTNDLLVFDYY